MPQSRGFFGPVLVSENRAYVGGMGMFPDAEVSVGVHILDTTDPLNPRRLGQCAGLALAISGEYLYVGTDSGLEVLEVSDPANPRRVGSYTDGSPWRGEDQRGALAVLGRYAYWAEPSMGLHVLDISDPANLRVVATLPIASRAAAIAVVGNFAYVAKQGNSTDLTDKGLSVIDISDPINPRRVGNYETRAEATLVGIAGGYAYLAERNGAQDLLVIDIQEPATPKEVNRFDLFGQGSFGLNGLAVSGNTLYLAAFERLGMLDVTDATHPRLVGLSAILDVIGGFGTVGEYVYVTGLWSGLVILQPRVANPQRLGELRLRDLNGAQATVSGDYAYLADHGLQIIDVHDLSNPRLVGSYTNVFAEDVAVSGDYACVAVGERGLEIIDVTDPAHPVRVGGLGELADASRVVVSGPFAYVASWRAGVAVVDIGNPAIPRRVARFGSFATAMAVKVAGHFAYTTGTEGGLRIYDISNPASPTVIGGVGGRFRNLAVADGLALVTEEPLSAEGGLVIADIRERARPKVIGRYSSPLFLKGVAVAGDYAYLAVDPGLNVIDISTPATPRLVGANPLVGNAYSVMVDRGHLFSYGYGTLAIFDLFRPFRLESSPEAALGAFRLRVDGPRGVSAWVQRSTDLRQWDDWQSVRLGATAAEVLDPDAATTAPRFYRAIIR